MLVSVSLVNERCGNWYNYSWFSEGGFVNEAHTKRGLLRFAVDMLPQRSMSYFVPDVVLIDDK